MKTTTILNAYGFAVRDLCSFNPHERSERQRDKFRAALLARIEAGDKARETLKLAAAAYRANEGGVLDVILRWAESDL